MAERVQIVIEVQTCVSTASLLAGSLVSPLALGEEEGWVNENAPRDGLAVCACGAHASADAATRRLLNGRNVCTDRCLQVSLQAAVRSEQRYVREPALAGEMQLLLGRILIEQGTITEAQLARALASQLDSGVGLLGCWLKQQMHLPELAFTNALATQWNCPILAGPALAPVTGCLPRVLLEQHGALPFTTASGNLSRDLRQRWHLDPQQALFLGFEDHVDRGVIAAAERMHGVPVKAVLLTATDFWHQTRDLLGNAFPPCRTVETDSPESMIEALEKLIIATGTRQAGVVAIHDKFWLRFWMPDARSSDGSTPYDIVCTLHGTGFPTTRGADTAGVLARQMLRVLD